MSINTLGSATQKTKYNMLFVCVEQVAVHASGACLGSYPGNYHTSCTYSSCEQRSPLIDIPAKQGKRNHWVGNPRKIPTFLGDFCSKLHRLLSPSANLCGGN